MQACNMHHLTQAGAHAAVITIKIVKQANDRSVAMDCITLLWLWEGILM